MPPTNREAGYLWDMLEAARQIQQFTANLSYENYLDSILLQSAVEPQLEILGEASRRMSRRVSVRTSRNSLVWYYLSTECYCSPI